MYSLLLFRFQSPILQQYEQYRLFDMIPRMARGIQERFQRFPLKK